jgi:hypothetical protein
MTFHERALVYADQHVQVGRKSRSQNLGEELTYDVN